MLRKVQGVHTSISELEPRPIRPIRNPIRTPTQPYTPLYATLDPYTLVFSDSMLCMRIAIRNPRPYTPLDAPYTHPRRTLYAPSTTLDTPYTLAPICTRTQYLVHYLHKHWVLASTSSPLKGDNAPKCSRAESSNANFSFPEHFGGKRQSGEMYQKDCLPLLSTFCKFQRLKVKGSRVMLVCLHQHSRTRMERRLDAMCAGCSAHSEIQLFINFLGSLACLWIKKRQP